MASHDADFVAEVCDRVVVMEAGGVTFDGPAGDFWSDPTRAAARGVHVPQAAELAARLRALGARDLPPCPGEAALAAALEALASSAASSPEPGAT